MVLDKKVIGNLSILVGNEGHTGRLSRLLIDIGISHKNSLLFLESKGGNNLLDGLRVRFGVLDIEGSHHHIEIRPEVKPLHNMFHGRCPVGVDDPKDSFFF